jgi:sporulation protein YlmC with PRC-barrel domain
MSYVESKPRAHTGGVAGPDVWYAPDRIRARKADSEKIRRRTLAQITILAMAFLAVLAALAIVMSPKIALSQGVQLVKVDVAVVAKGYRASKLIGAGVTNDKNEKIGSLDDIIIDQKQVLFAVLQVGGFLGIGKHLVAVPYDSLQISEDGKKVALPGASKDELKKLSEFKYQA